MDGWQYLRCLLIEENTAVACFCHRDSFACSQFDMRNDGLFKVEHKPIWNVDDLNADTFPFYGADEFFLFHRCLILIKKYGYAKIGVLKRAMVGSGQTAPTQVQSY